MARNEEKAQSMLNRYLQTTRAWRAGEKRRPYLSTLCDDVDEAEKWRQQIIRDIRVRVEEIQNVGLDQSRVRELNDSINKLLRERGHWERRIVALGGTDHSKARRQANVNDVDPNVFKHNEMFYFGAAKKLPDVMQLMAEKQRVAKRGRTRSLASEQDAEAVQRRIDVAYYGYTVADEGVDEIMRVEAEAQERLQKRAVEVWEEGNSGKADDDWDDCYVQYIGRDPSAVAEAEMESLLIERKKAEALEQLDVTFFSGT